MSYYSERPDEMAEVQAMAVDLVDRLTPILRQAADDPWPGPWSELSHATKSLQDFYELSFVQLAAHPEPWRSEELAAVVRARIDHAAHRETSHGDEDRRLTPQEEAACAESANSTTEHLLYCLGAIGQSAPGSATSEDKEAIGKRITDPAHRSTMAYTLTVHRRLATATVEMLS